MANTPRFIPYTIASTDTYVDWPNTWPYAWQWFQTPDISFLIRERVYWPEWSSGNNIGLRLSNPSGAGTNWATADYAFGPYDGVDPAGHSATLYVTYVAP